jgi:hypothetical protein
MVTIGFDARPVLGWLSVLMLVLLKRILQSQEKQVQTAPGCHPSGIPANLSRRAGCGNL